MNQRTLVKASAGEYCIGFKTISPRRKSGREFLISRSELERLEYENETIVRDIHSFAILRRDIFAGTLSIDFSWLNSGCGGKVSGWEEKVTLPYDELITFARASAQEDGPKKWSALSVERNMTPKIEFADKSGLRKCLENRTVRGKLARALRDNFRGAERIVLYHDFEAYSFMFQSFRADRPLLTGGLIFHNYQNDLKKAYYSVHT